MVAMLVWLVREVCLVVFRGGGRQRGGVYVWTEVEGNAFVELGATRKVAVAVWRKWKERSVRPCVSAHHHVVSAAFTCQDGESHSRPKEVEMVRVKARILTTAMAG